MKQILADIQREAGDTLSTVVYLGAGDGACLADLAGLSCRRTILVEADPLCIETLHASASPGVEIVNAMVSASEGEVTFHRFTLPFLNGPLPREHFVAVYPRLSLVETIALPTRPLSSLLGQIAITGGSPNLLIVDLPGQEEALLPSLTHIDTEHFSHILVRRFAAGRFGASHGLAFVNHLASLGFDLIKEDTTSDPAWPLFQLKKDPVKQSMQQELERRAQLLVGKATQIHQQIEQIAALTSEREALASRVSALELEHSDLATRYQQLVTESEVLRSNISAKSTLLDVLTKGRIAQDEQMDKLLLQQKTLVSERDALASHVSDLLSQVEKLEAHAKLIDEEFGKAEGQIDLIKDIFLREAIR